MSNGNCANYRCGQKFEGEIESGYYTMADQGYESCGCRLEEVSCDHLFHWWVAPVYRFVVEAFQSRYSWLYGLKRQGDIFCVCVCVYVCVCVGGGGLCYKEDVATFNSIP